LNDHKQKINAMELDFEARFKLLNKEYLTVIEEKNNN
jgi:hypothetical protein